MSNIELESLCISLGERLVHKGWSLSTAESCTGGWVSQAVTSIAGSSQWFDRGFVTYTNQAKQEMLGVQAETLNNFGAVSEATVLEMVRGAIENSQAQCALAVSGIAGPGGGSEAKPVGTVCFAWQCLDQAQAVTEHFKGDRHSIRLQSVHFALQGLLQGLS